MQNEAEQRETLSHGSGVEREWNIERERERERGGKWRQVQRSVAGATRLESLHPFRLRITESKLSTFNAVKP